MSVHILNYEPNRIGGGWTASRYLYEGLEAVSYDEADTILITGPTMANHDEVMKAKNDGKKIVLRLDNHLLGSRNRNTGMSRMKAFCDLADLLIYQSKWALDYLYPFTKKDGAVILNGVDTKIFNSSNRMPNSHCLYIRSSRIAEKGWEMARYWYSYNFERRDLGVLNIVGKFSRENLEYNFDFYNHEPYNFMGEQPREQIATLMKHSQYFLYPYFMDACSNTLLEAKASGCEIIDVYGMLQTGGAPEIMECKDISVERMIREYKEIL